MPTEGGCGGEGGDEVSMAGKVVFLIYVMNV